jgi:hypothetical protein
MSTIFDISYRKLCLVYVSTPISIFANMSLYKMGDYAVKGVEEAVGAAGGAMDYIRSSAQDAFDSARYRGSSKIPIVYTLNAAGGNDSDTAWANILIAIIIVTLLIIIYRLLASDPSSAGDLTMMERFKMKVRGMGY